MSSLTRAALYNVLGLGLPLVAAVFTIPFLIANLGAASFGVLTLLWAVSSYFGLLDLGLGRAMTRELSPLDPQRNPRDWGIVFWTGLATMSALGCVAGVGMALASGSVPRLIGGVKDSEEVINAVRWMALAMPAILLTTGLRGVLEARMLFGIINIIRIPLGVFTFVGPAMAVHLGHQSLSTIACVLTIGRFLGALAHAWAVASHIPISRFHYSSDNLRKLVTAGGWFTVSGLIGPLMNYFDRFLLAGVSGIAAVTYYATPLEIITKLWILPSAVAAVLFPAFSRSKAAGAESGLFRKATAAIFALELPIIAILALFSHEILTLWISVDFANRSHQILSIFALGMLINSIAYVPLAFLQAKGAYRQTAVLQVCEMLVFLPLVIALAKWKGAQGAALAWSLRCAVDATALFLLARLRRVGPSPLIMIAVLCAMITILAGAQTKDLLLRIMVLVACAGFSAFVGMKVIRRTDGVDARHALDAPI